MLALSMCECDRGRLIPNIQFPTGALSADPEQVALGEIRRLLEGAIDTLPIPFREVFIMREVEGLSTEQTAQVLSIEPETAKTRLHRARTRPRRALHDQLAPALMLPAAHAHRP